MAKISNTAAYPNISNIDAADYLIITDAENNLMTKTVTIAQVSSLIAQPYTSYVQLLTQSGTAAPTGPILQNTAGITITWAYTSSGRYAATYSTPLTDINKAAISCSQTTKNSGGGMIVNVTASSASGFNATCKDAATVTGIDSQLLAAVLEIRIYP
jgi:hypothetical protein